MTRDELTGAADCRLKIQLPTIALTKISIHPRIGLGSEDGVLATTLGPYLAGSSHLLPSQGDHW